MTPLGILFPASTKNDTEQIFITWRELNVVQKSLINSKIYRLLGIIDLKKINNWNQIKGQSMWINARLEEQRKTNNSRRLAIPWSNYIALGVGNTSAYVEKHKSLFNKVRKRNENVNLMVCLCHIVHNTAGKSIRAFCDDITEYFDIQELLVDIYFLFDCSSERKKMR